MGPSHLQQGNTGTRFLLLLSCSKSLPLPSFSSIGSKHGLIHIKRKEWHAKLFKVSPAEQLMGDFGAICSLHQREEKLRGSFQRMLLLSLKDVETPEAHQEPWRLRNNLIIIEKVYKPAIFRNDWIRLAQPGFKWWVMLPPSGETLHYMWVYNSIHCVWWSLYPLQNNHSSKASSLLHIQNELFAYLTRRLIIDYIIGTKRRRKGEIWVYTQWAASSCNFLKRKGNFLLEYHYLVQFN